MAWIREAPNGKVKGCWRDHTRKERSKTFATRTEALRYAKRLEALEGRVYGQRHRLAGLVDEVDRLLRENEQVREELLTTRANLIVQDG